MAVDQDTGSAIALLYRRAGFGAGSAQVAAGVSQGYWATVDALIAGLGTAPDPHGDAVAQPAFAARSAPAAGDVAARKAQRAVYRQETPATQDWWMNRMIVTDTPLREKMTLNWSGHFATGISKVADPQLMYGQNQLFRTSGAGPFSDLAQAVAKDPAMMIWLDTDLDDAKHPNENFARENMELFTIGIGNYTQADVTAAAAAFTGYSLDRTTFTYVYRPKQHANGTVTFLGTTGNLTGEDVINILVHKPASARFIVAGAWSHLAYPVATNDAVVGELLAAYTPDSDFSSLLQAIFLHPLFLSKASEGGLVKQPIEYLAGAARALRLDANLQPLDPTTGLPAATAAAPAKGKSHRLVDIGTALGQTVYDPPSVGGWPQNGYWLNTATSLARWQAARLMAEAADLSAIEAVSPSGRPDAVAALLGVGAWGSATAKALAQVASEPPELVTLALNAPEYVLA